MKQILFPLNGINFEELFLARITRVVAIDFGEAFITYVEVNFKGNVPSVLNFDIIPLPSVFREKKEYNEAAIDLITESFKKKKIKAKDVVMVISGGSVFSRKIKLAKLPKKELESGIKWEASNQIPFSLDSSYFDWQFLQEIELPSGAKNHEYMIVATSKKTVDDMVDLSLKLDLLPCCVGVPAFAIHNLAKISNQFDDEERIAVIDIGFKRINIVIIHKKVILFARELPLGDTTFNEAIMNEFSDEKWDYHYVDKIKREKKVVHQAFQDEQSIDDISTKRLIGVIRPVLERMINEIRRSFDYFREQSGGVYIDRIVLSGRGSVIEGFDEIFHKTFRVPISNFEISDIFKPGQQLDVGSFNKHFLELIIVLGLAVGQQKQINFLPASYKEKKIRRSQLAVVIALLATVFSVCLLLTIQINLVIAGLNKEIGLTQAQMQNIIPQIQAFNEKCLSYKTDRRFYEGIKKRQLILSGALKELSNSVPRSIVFERLYLEKGAWISITGFVFDDDTNSISNESVLTDFIIAIENSPFFKAVKLVSSERGEKFEVPHSKFSISCELISKNDI